MKHFVDIENLRENDIDLGNGIIRLGNASGFKPGDLISITEKVDGSNASIRYNAETGKLDAFSRKNELGFGNTLSGFWNYVNNCLNPDEFAATPNFVVFGEWLIKNKITYDKECMRKWYVYSIFDVENEVWLPQSDVKEFCASHNLIYVHELYYGPFVSWDHCREFCHSSIYGDTQEGIVVRNLTRLANNEERLPHILKIVNDEFKESMVKRKEVDPDKEAAKANAQSLLESVVTRSRVEKMLLKLRDEGILSAELTPKDMGIVGKHLPKRIYEDCIKEEPEVVVAAGEYAGKTISHLTMKLAKEIIVG